MKFSETGVAGAWQLDPERLSDDRGFFARVWSDDDAAAHGLNPTVQQCNISFNPEAGTLRGLHFQRAPHAEAMLIRCTAGAVFDVVVDLRPESPTFKRWYGAELTADNRRLLYIPEGCAHGYLTLVDASEVFYQVSTKYTPEAAGGVRWNDPAFGITWPVEVRKINDRDRDYPDFT